MLDFSDQVRFGMQDPEGDDDFAPVCEIRQIGDAFQVYDEEGDIPVFTVMFATLQAAVDAVNEEGWDLVLTPHQRLTLYGNQEQHVDPF